MKEVRIADLKARLSDPLRYVRRGHVPTVLDREAPVAPPPSPLAGDAVAVLLEERLSGR